MSTTAAVILICGVIAVAFVAWYLMRQRRSQALRRQFGPEYDHAVRELGGPERAERALAERKKRMDKIHIHPLPPEERDRYADEWHHVQSRFVDDPPGSIAEADRLVNRVMSARGYPMGDFERRADDLSVDHPHVVRNYRSAHDIALAREKGQASTEDLRHALVCFRQLFEELLGVHEVAGSREVRR